MSLYISGILQGGTLQTLVNTTLFFVGEGNGVFFDGEGNGVFFEE